MNPYPVATSTISRLASVFSVPSLRRASRVVALGALGAGSWALGVAAPGPSPREPTPPATLARARVAPRCDGARLRLSSVAAPGGSLHDGVIVRVRDVGRRACTVSGYATVRGVNRWNGAPLSATPTRTSYLGGWNRRGPLPSVTLRPGSGVASFLVTGVDTAIDNPACPELVWLRVAITPRSSVVTLPVSLNACRFFQVHPFVPGVRGTAG